ncbi:MAG: hypothetical protein RMK84_20330, partial [Oscillochloridaceae bacterium]|nr:hypothetical protein [Oscillochloridaceae bacterium]
MRSRQIHRPARGERRGQRGGVRRLHRDQPHVGAHRLEIGGDPGGEPAAADGHEQRVERTGLLGEQLHRHRALAGDHQRVVEGVDQTGAAARGQGLAMRRRLVVAVAVEDQLGAKGAHRLDLDRRRGHRHHDRGLDPEVAGGERHALGVVA